MAGTSVFQWGDKVAGSLSSYESMYFKGVRYTLYDCAFVRSGLSEPYVGKLMRLFEDERGVKKVRLRWFFRPQELPISARKDFRQEQNVKDVFIAQGSMKGVENENSVEVLLGKATVLCTAKCRDNPVPSQLHVNSAHHIFNRVYDVSNKKIGKIDKIDKSLAQKVFNKPEWLRAAENVPRDVCSSPTSVRDFDMVAKARPLLQTPSLKLKVKRPSMELLPLTQHVKRPSLEPLPLTQHVKRPSLEPLPLTQHVRRPSLEPLPLTQHVRRPSLEPATNQLKSRQEERRHEVIILRRDLQRQDEIIVLD